MDLLNLVLTLRPTGAGKPPPRLARAAPAVLLQRIAAQDPHLATLLHDEEGPKPLTCSDLLGPRRNGAISPEQTYTLRYTALIAPVAEALANAFTPGETLTFEGVDFSVLDCAPTPAAPSLSAPRPGDLSDAGNPWIGAEEYQTLAARHLLSADGPTRLHYSGTVFRAQKPGSGRPEERRQVGAELIGRGATGVQADAEILSMAAEGLISIGLRDFCIGLSDAKLLSAILDAAGARDYTRERIRSALAARDYVLYGELVSSLDGAAVSVELLRRLPHIHARAEILEALRTPGVCEAAEGLGQTLDALDNRGLGRYFRLDLAITRRFRYYTGVVFEGYAPGCGNAVIGGGRYDDLLACFGASAPAAGFAVDVDSVASALGAQTIISSKPSPANAVNCWS